jgi:hypothetical protein
MHNKSCNLRGRKPMQMHIKRVKGKRRKTQQSLLSLEDWMAQRKKLDASKRPSSSLGRASSV